MTFKNIKDAEQRHYDVRIYNDVITDVIMKFGVEARKLSITSRKHIRFGCQAYHSKGNSKLHLMTYDLHVLTHVEACDRGKSQNETELHVLCFLFKRIKSVTTKHVKLSI